MDDAREQQLSARANDDKSKTGLVVEGCEEEEDDEEDEARRIFMHRSSTLEHRGLLKNRKHSGKRLPSSSAGLGTCDVGSAIITATLPTAASAGGGAGMPGGGRTKPRTVRIEEAESPPSKKKQASIRIHEACTKTKIKSHSIHGMTEEDADARPHREMGILTYEEKKFLLAVERGDVASVTRMLQSTVDSGVLNINCCDPLGRSALLMGIDNENLEMVDLLLDNKVETKDALLHAINEEFVEAVEVLLEHEETIHKEGEPHSWEAIPPDTANFTPDITPLVLAAHRDNYEIIKILLDRGAILPVPHDVRCGCDECSTCRSEDSLRHSRSRINAYRALASPSLIALSSKDPILTAFELSWELRRLSVLEHEFKSEYLELRTQCQKFATALLDHTRSSTELEILLNHDPTGPVFQHGERMHLNRLKLAIKYRQKKFVAHPNVQQLLASIWYEGLPGFRQMNMFLQTLEVCRIGLLFPFFSLAYIVFPCASFSLKLRKPFIKFICTSASYFTFLFLLILASQRIEVVIAEWFQNERLKEWLSMDVTTKRGATPTMVEWAILSWVAGLIWSEIKQLWEVGLREYVSDMWNVVDFVTNSLYVATIALRLVAYYKVQEEIRRGSPTAHLPREHWDTWDPMLISEGLFAAANIFSNLKLVYIFSVNPYLGPLQVSLSRMVMDIMKFISLFVLVLFAFSCGANQLLWYYADLEKQRCFSDQLTSIGKGNFSQPIGNISYANYTGGSGPIIHDINHCLAWRRFANLWETSQTLFWAIFGLIDLDNFELTGIKEFTRFSGLLMFGSFSVINIIVLLNLLIAMMNHSYQLISVSSEKADIEWKFARSKLWISYFEEGGTVPPPFNIIPTPKSMFYCLRWIYQKLCGRSHKIKKEHLKTRKNRQASERDIRYQAVMRNLVRRYVTLEQRKAESQGVTEDDVNEIKNDISAFRFELIEILRSSGMNTASATGPSGAAGKKNRLKERRLMKGFNLSTSGLGTSIGGAPTGPPGSETFLSVPVCKKASLTLPPNEITIDMIAQVKKSPMHRLARLAKMAGTARDNFVNLGMGADSANSDSVPPGYRWGTLMQGVGRSPGAGSAAGSTEEGENGTWIPSRPPLGSRTSNTSDDSSIATTVPNELGRTSSSKRDKYSKTRNPIQCLNPTQLQPPSSVQKAETLSESKLELGGNEPSSKYDGSRKSLQRMFRFDSNDPDGESPPPFNAGPSELETIFGSSSSTPTSFPLIDDQPEALHQAPTASAHNGSANTSASTCMPTATTTSSTSGAPASSTTSSPLLPGLTPAKSKNRAAVNSGWL